MTTKMKTTLTVLALSCALIIASCAKKTKPDEVLPDTSGLNGQNATTDDSKIQNKDLSFDPQGSDSGNITGLYTVHFDYDKSALSAEARGNMDKNVAWMKSHAAATVQVEGHCDRHGSIEYNLALGERRAKAVRAYMINLGVEGKRLTTISYGKEKPLDSSETETADGKNRRANFVVQSSK
jgi:peptidoglycan-associated lipoprotein